MNQKALLARRFRARSRARAAGFLSPSLVLEASLVMGWFCVLLVGEIAICKAVDARGNAENAAEESASKSSASYCTPQGASSTDAQTTPSVKDAGKPDVQRALAAIAGLGLGSERTFPNYVLPLQSIHVSGMKQESLRMGRKRTEEAYEFVAERGLGCLEKPLDVPKGSLDEFRDKLWVTKLKGY